MIRPGKGLRNYWMNMSIAESNGFFGKILLLGEYGIIYGGQALTVPLKKYKGYFDFPQLGDDLSDFAVSSNESLCKYLDYLKGIASKKLLFPLDIERLENELNEGLYFRSTIPQGYGAGSSGALVAAIFDRYSNANRQSEDIALQLPAIRKQLAVMESYFHGSSSGLDPLSCYVGEPLLIRNDGEIEVQSSPFTSGLSNIKVFLLDTHQTGNTKPLVDGFKERVVSGEINITLLHAINDRAIVALATGKEKLLMEALFDLSRFQLEYMKPMIPENIVSVWEEGIGSGRYVIKLCGSGGGGFMLGFMPEENAKSQSFQGNGFDIQFLAF
jgi:mevalonate kinase